MGSARLGLRFGGGDQRDARLEARAQVLTPLRGGVSAETRQLAADPLGLLRPDRSPMPFRGRVRQVRQLATWRDDADSSPVVLLSGPAGSGKSRLALEFASRVPDGWVAGWLRAGTGDIAVTAIAACADPAVILVDDADGRDDVVRLLDSLTAHRGTPVIRVVLVTRSADGLRASLMARLEEPHARIAAAAPAIDLAPVGGADDWTRWFGEAVRAFADTLGRPVPELPGDFPDDHADAGQSFVLIQAWALLAVLGQETAGQPDPRTLPFGEVAAELMRHEKRRWDALTEARDWGSGGAPSCPLRERAVAALALLGADGAADADEVLRRVPELRAAAAERRHEIAAWVSELCPAGAGSAPPGHRHVIGEWAAVHRLSGDQPLADGLRGELTDDQADRALGFLARAADWTEAAGPLFGKFANGNRRRTILAATHAALAGEAGRRLLDPVVAGKLTTPEGWPLTELQDLEDLIPGHLLPLTDAAITAHIVSVCRALAAAGPAARRADLAAALIDSAIALERLGRGREGLIATTEAVSLYRVLAAADPATYRAVLAAALSSLAAAYSRLGRHHKALQTGQEAVTLLRALAEDGSAAHRAALARALANLGSWLDQLGRHEEAQAASEEAVARYRAMAADNPACQADLAGALGNLGAWYDRLGRHEEALTATREAVARYRAMAGDAAKACQPDLAGALGSLAATLRQLGRQQEALTVTEEAVARYRALAAADPAAHEAGLARALDRLGASLRQLRRQQEALTAAEEAVTLFRPLAAGDPGAHQAGLASALDSLGASLAATGQRQDGLAATQEAVVLYHALAAGDPAAHQARFATALDNLSSALDQAGRHRESLDAQAEAVDVYREMAARDTERYQAEYQRRLGALLTRPPRPSGETQARKPRAYVLDDSFLSRPPGEAPPSWL